MPLLLRVCVAVFTQHNRIFIVPQTLLIELWSQVIAANIVKWAQIRW